MSFSLFHLEGYWTRSNNQPVSGKLRHFESQQCSVFGGLKAIFYDTRAHVAYSDMIIPGLGQIFFIAASPRFSLVAHNSARWPYA